MAHKLPPFYARLRFATATISTGLLNLNVFGFSLKSACSPGFNCHGCPWATTACPIGVMAFASAMHTVPVLAIASVLAVGALLGRLVCGFACPFGLLQDLLHKLPGPKITLPRFFRYGKYLALALLVFLLPWFLGFEPSSSYLLINKPKLDKAADGSIAVTVTVQNLGTEPVRSPHLDVAYRQIADSKEIHRSQQDFPDLTIPPGDIAILPAFKVPNLLETANLVIDSPQATIQQHPRWNLYYCAICPNGTLTSSLPRWFMGSSTTSIYDRIAGSALRLSILAVFLVLMVVSSRPFCHLFCPLGAIYAMTTPLAISRMTLEQSECIHCKRCDRACPMDLDVPNEVGGAECIACGDCMNVCPQEGIRRRFGLGGS